MPRRLCGEEGVAHGAALFTRALISDFGAFRAQLAQCRVDDGFLCCLVRRQHRGKRNEEFPALLAGGVGDLGQPLLRGNVLLTQRFGDFGNIAETNAAALRSGVNF